MAYKALYRIYRPQTFDEVVGQKYIVQTLKHAIEENKIAHAYLFTGPRGTGKTTISKLLAKGVNCLENEGRPCGKCASCLAIQEGSHPDVIEIDAASNNGVDEVRELIDKVKYSPVEGKYKVYIIDEVHMMTPGAFNALLKTLEEPPAHVIFVLATTEVHKVLPTIVSRCQRFDFGRISKIDLKQRMETVLKEENVEYEKDAIELIADLADGGVRDALGIVDQALAYSGGDLKVQDIREIYGVVSTQEVIDFLKTCHDGDIESALKTIDVFEHKGIDISRFTGNLIDVLKELVVYKKTKKTSLLKYLDEEKASSLARVISSDDAFAQIEILMEAQANYKKANTPKSYFELACLKLCHIEHKEDKIVVQKEERKVVETIVEKTVVTETPRIEEKEIVQPKEKIEPIVKQEETTVLDSIPVQVVEESKEIKKEEEKPVENKIVSQPKASKSKIIYDESDVLNIMVQATAEDRKAATEKWVLIKQYITKPNFAKAARYLQGSVPSVVTPNAIIITTDLKPNAELINFEINHNLVKEFLIELMGEEKVFIAMSTDEFKKFRLLFLDKKSKNALPNPRQIEQRYERVEEEKKETSQQSTFTNSFGHEEDEDPVTSFGKNIFGDLFNKG